MIELAVDNTNVETLPVGNLQDIGGMLRKLADDLDASAHGDVISVVSIVVRPDGLSIFGFGDNCSAYEMMGMFEAAKLRVFADDMLEDD